MRMKMVIELSEEVLERIDTVDSSNIVSKLILKAIKNGKPLSAGSRKEKNSAVLNTVKENIEILKETDMDSLGEMNTHLINITMVLCDMSRSLAVMADTERTVKE